MSDKDDNVEMSVDITADNIPAVANNNPTSVPADNSPNSADNLPDSVNSFPSCEDVSEEMGQLKSKLKKLKEKKKENEEEESEELEIELDEGDGDFMCGVVEGFYGRPWTTAQRKELFRRMQSMGLNTYLYGPKDDYKHRLCWRDLYTEDETALMKILIESAAEHDVLFIYAISPGLDMSFASDKELEYLKNKLLQVQSLGCKAFALLFDDIDPILRAPDKMQFSSAASAQATVTNQMQDLLGRPKFLFCPTEYCNSMACPDVSTSKYLKTIGKELNRNISIMWTGPKVVSKRISVESIKELTRIVRRKVVIWDNIHANDYDPKRVFLGPYKGRSTELIPHLAGVLTNPNCEFESNFIAMHTLSTWWKSHIIKPTGTEIDKHNEQDKKSDVEMESEGKKTDSEDLEEQKENTENQEKIEKKPEKEPEMKEEAEIMSGKDEKSSNEEIEKENDSQEAREKKEDLLVDSSPTEQYIAEAAPSSSPMSSASSSAIGSDSDTDSDYSSHDEYYYRRHSPPFDHGTYDPEESLREAIKNWLPYFSASRLPLGKPIPRSGPPLGMLPQCDVSLMTSAQMGPVSSLTSALPNDPILSTPFKYGCPGHTPNIEIRTGDEKDTKESAENTDIEMAGATPPSGTQTIEGASELDEKAPSDVDMKSEQEREKDENMQMGDLDETHPPKMETEDEDLMQYEAEPDSDVSMTTNNSGIEKKTSNEDAKDDGRDRSVSGSSVDMATHPGHLPSSCEQGLEATPEQQADSETAPSLFKMDQMSLEDVELAVELFYLPYEHGVVGRKMVQEFVWLQCNVRQASAAPKAFTKSEKNENLDKALEWMERAIQFEDSCMAIRRMCNKLTSCSNRALLYDLFPYFWDMKGVVSMLSSYVKWMGQFYLRHTSAKTSAETGSNSSKPGSPGSKPASPPSASSVPCTPPTGPWLGPDPESWVFKGGLSGELQRLLPVTMANDLFYQAIPCTPQTTNSTYVIRPYLQTDEKSVYKICLSTGNDGTDFADDFTGYEDLPGERLVGGLLTLSPEYCFVVEDEIGICGYLVGAANARSFWKKYSVAFLPEVKEKYSLPKENEDEEASGKLGEEVRRLLEEICSDDSPDAYAMDNLYTSHPAYMQIAVHRRASDPSIARSMTVCVLSALKSHGVHGVHTTVRSSDCYMPDLYCRLGFHEIRPIDPSPVTPAPLSSTYKDDTFIVFGRTF